MTTLADVNDALAPFGSRLSPIGRLAGKEIVGKTDRELPWAESADILRANDKRVFETGKPSFIHKCDQA